jgi:hypothetical protein
MMEKGLKGGDGAGGHGVEGWWCAVTEAGTLTLLSCVEDDKGEGYSLEGVSGRRWAGKLMGRCWAGRVGHQDGKRRPGGREVAWLGFLKPFLFLFLFKII